jgi:hypothetical protein
VEGIGLDGTEQMLVADTCGIEVGAALAPPAAVALAATRTDIYEPMRLQSSRMQVVDDHPNGRGAVGEFFGFATTTADTLFNGTSWDSTVIDAEVNGAVQTVILYRDDSMCGGSCGSKNIARGSGDWAVGDLLIFKPYESRQWIGSVATTFRCRQLDSARLGHGANRARCNNTG